ncbi:MAG: cupin domain-containing protein, partial [Planctomycetota bacterium]
MRMDHQTGPKLVSNLYYVINKVRKPETTVKSHSHGYNEIIYIISGKLTITADKSNYQLEHDDCLFIKADTDHKLTNTNQSELQFLNIAYYGIMPEQIAGQAFKA